MTDENSIKHAIESTKNSKKVLVLFAHPAQTHSEVNVPLFHEAKMNRHVTAVDLYAEYPDFNIDIEREQQRLIDHDVVVFLFPLYWYSTPSILKEWQDLVLEYGFAYGHEGTALKGKLFLCAISAGGKEEAYQTEGFNHYTIRQLLQPLEQMAQITHMKYVAPFAIFGSRTAQEEHRLAEHRGKWKTLLNKLTTNTLDLEKAKQIENLADLCSSKGD